MRPVPSVWRCLMLFFLFAFGLLPALIWAQAVWAEAPSYGDLDGYKLNEVTLAGSHNTYDEKIDDQNHEIGIPGWEYYYDALEDVEVIELDFYNIANEFNVSHSSPVSSDNNCPKHGWPGSTRNQDLDSCIQALRYWHDLNPNHPLVVIKMEPKLGFDTALANAPAELDRQIAFSLDYRSGRLDVNGDEIMEPRLPPDIIFKPRDLLCKNRPSCSQGFYANLQEAIEHNNWPTMAELRGKFMFTIVPGTANASGPRKYADKLENNTDWNTPPCNPDSCTDTWIAFPAVFALNDQDPIDWYLDGNACAPIDCGFEGGDRRLRPWFVVIDFQAGRVLEHTVPETLLDSLAAQRYLMFATFENPSEDISLGTPVTDDQARLQLNLVAKLANANVVDTDVEKGKIPFAKARGRLDVPEVGPLYDLTGSGLNLQERTSGQCLGATDFGSHSVTSQSCPAVSRANSGYLGMSSFGTPAYAQARATDFMRFSVSFNARGEMRIGGLCLTANASALDGGATTLEDCALLIASGDTPVDPPNQQRWRLDELTGKIHSFTDDSFCLTRLAPLSDAIGTRSCATSSGYWYFGTRGPLNPPVGDQIVRIANPEDPYKQPPTARTCLTSDFTVQPFAKLWFQPCEEPPADSQRWRFNDFTGVISQYDAASATYRCLELSRVTDYAFFHDAHFFLNRPPEELAAQDPTQSLDWEDGLSFPSYYSRRGTSVGHRVYLTDCHADNPQQHFGWSADERRLVGVNGFVLFHDYWGGLRFRLGGTNKPQPGDPPLLDNGSDRQLAPLMNERLAGEVIDLEVVAQPPVALCKNITKAVGSQCTATVTTADIDAGTHTSGGSAFTMGMEPAGPFGLGTNSVFLLATIDDLALTGSCKAVVTVVDQTPPSLTLNGSATVSLQCGVDSYSEAGAVAGDNCSVNPAVTTAGAVNTKKLGSYLVAYNASDAAGNAAPALQRTVKVVDTVAPLLACPSDMTVDGTSRGGAEVTYPAVKVTDACGADAAPTYSQASGTLFTFGNSTVTVGLVDGGGNQASCSFKVKVLTLQEQTQEIIDQTKHLGQSNGLSQSQIDSLVEQLNGVIDAVNKEKSQVGCDQLNEFIQAIKALKTLTADQQKTLVDMATQLQTNMGFADSDSCVVTTSGANIHIPFLHR